MPDPSSSLFSLPLLQAINNWQIGGGKNQKAKRGQELKRQAASLPDRFRSCDLICYRRISLEKGDLFRLNDILELPETVSAWTVSLETARKVKDGVPDVGSQGIIFATYPSDGSVVANLDRIYRDADFSAAFDANKSAIERHGDGIGRYRNDQREVVLEIDTIQLVDIVELGGYSSSRDELAGIYARAVHGRNPTAADIRNFDFLLAIADRELIGPGWIWSDAKDRVLKKIQGVMPTLRTIKRLQDDPRHS